MSQVKLKICPISDYLFLNKEFEFTIELVYEHNEQLLVKGNHSNEINLNCLVLNESKKSLMNVLEVLEFAKDTLSLGYCKIKAKFISLSQKESYHLMIRVDAYHTKNQTNILSTISNPFRVVTKKLKVTEDNKEKYIWYKDEGGKDKCIELFIKLVNADDEIMLNTANLPLMVTLIYYENTMALPQQDILSLSPDSHVIIDHTGMGRIKLRINEVSNRHRGHFFQIRITPDFSHLESIKTMQLREGGGSASSSSNSGELYEEYIALFHDIAPGYSVPIEVKSKRNKENKNRLNQIFQQQSIIQDSNLLLSNMMTGIIPQPSMPTSFPMNILSHSIPSDTNASSFPLHVSASLTATAKLDSSTAVTSLMPQYFGPAISASVSASIPALSLLDKRLNSTELTENECVKRSRKSCMLTSPSVVAPLIDWITQATTSLEEMRWEPTGYERSITKNDGKSNQKVLYSMRNPNEMINQLLERFEKEVAPMIEQIQMKNSSSLEIFSAIPLPSAILENEMDAERSGPMSPKGQENQ